MADKTKSKTKKDSFVIDRVLGLGGHHKTTITGGGRKAEGLGRTSKESQKRASDKWDQIKGK